MDAHQWRGLSVYFSAHQSDRFFLRPVPFESVNSEAPVTRGQFCMRRYLHTSVFFLRLLPWLRFSVHLELKSITGLVPPANSPAHLLTSISLDFQFGNILFRLVQRSCYCHGALQASQSHVLAEKPGLRRGAERDNRAASLRNTPEEHAKG